jgi:hypothetical protein
VVRELTRKRVWFAEALISATAHEVRRLIAKAKEWAESLGKPVALRLSDKQDAFVTGIAAEFPDVPHRYCDNHFLRDVANPFWRPTATLIDRFERTEDPIRLHMATVTTSFLTGLFVGKGKFEEIKDNLDLERWFRLPRSHERRIHGHRHAGVRIVQDGPTLVLALDAHAAHPRPFNADELLPCRMARVPPRQREALNRRKLMRKARSNKQRTILLADLERRYRESANF